MRIIKKKNQNSLINEFIRIFKKEVLKKKKANKRLSFVLTGGTSPRKLYSRLAKSKIDWSEVDFFWGDERLVSKKSVNSNYKLAYDLLLSKINIDKANIFSIDISKNINNTCLKYQEKIKKYFGNNKVNFDIFLLGMGRDGHIASLFPNSKLLKSKFLVNPIFRDDFKRISLSIDTINNSTKIFLWLNKKSKTKIYEKLKNKGKKIPVNNLKKDKLFCFSIN